jgi:PAS domain-containing protein
MFSFLRKLIGRRSTGATAGSTAPRAAAGGPGRAGTALRPGEEQFAKLVAGVRDYAVFMLDPHGRVATWNTGAERLKGYRAAEILGQHFSRFYPREAVERGWPEEELRWATADG